MRRSWPFIVSIVGLVVGNMAHSSSLHVYLGTQNADDTGVMHSTFDSETGALSTPALAIATADQRV
jgi:hypothetical protein